MEGSRTLLVLFFLATALPGLSQDTDSDRVSADLIHELRTEQRVQHVRFSPLGTYLVAGGYFGRVTVFDRDFDTIWVHSPPVRVEGQGSVEEIWRAPVAVSPDESLLFIANYTRKGDVGVVELETGKKVTRISADPRYMIENLRLSGDGSFLAAATKKRLTGWHIETESASVEKIGEATLPETDDMPLWSLDFDEVRIADGGEVVLAFLENGYIAEYRMEPEPFTRARWIPEIPDGCTRAEVEGRSGDFSHCVPWRGNFAVSPDDRWIVTGTENAGITFFRRGPGDEIEQTQRIADPPEDVQSLAFGGDARTLFVTEGERVRLWLLQDGRWERGLTLTPHANHNRLALSPRGEYLAASTTFSYEDSYGRYEPVEPAIRIWSLSRVGARPAAHVAELAGGRLSAVQKHLLTPGRARDLLDMLGEDMLAPRGVFETEEEYTRRRAEAGRRVRTRLQELTEDAFDAEVEEIGPQRARVTVALAERGTYDIDAGRYTVPVMGQQAVLTLERDAARTLYRNWREARISMLRVEGAAGYDYMDFELRHPDVGEPVPVRIGTNPFTGAREDPLEERRPVTEVGPHLELRNLALEGLFPSLYRHYSNNPVGRVTVANAGSTTVSDIAVALSVPQVTGQPATTRLSGPLGLAESRELALAARFDRRLLSYTEGDTVTARLEITYDAGGATHGTTVEQPVQILNRNALRWDDDRKIAAFMSVNEPIVTRFVTAVAGMDEGHISAALTRNLHEGMRFYEAIRATGMKYVIDPRSAYQELSRDALATDHLRFPAETLSLGAGDCDDLSVLFNTLLESVGVATAFVTTPGHIFAAFDAGISPAEARRLFSRPQDFIVRDDRVWLPVEATLLEQGFLDAWRTAARQWRTAREEGTAGFFTTEAAMATYRPVGVELDAEVAAPDASRIRDAYREELSALRTREADHHIARLEQTAESESATGLARMGLVYARYGFHEQALRHFDRSIEREPTVPAFLNAALVSSQLQRHQQAVSYLERALRLDSQHPRVHLAMAVTRLKSGDTEAARRSYERVRSVSPSLAERYRLFAAAGETDGSRAGGDSPADSYMRDGLMEP